MNRLPASATQSLALLKNVPLPAAFKTEGMPTLVKNLFLGQLAFYGAYQLVSGPNKMKLKRYFTVSPESGLQGLATFHLCHTSAVPLLFNLTVLSTIGSHVCRTRGLSAFTTLLAMGCAGASLAVAIDARSNHEQVQAGSIGASAALLAYQAFKAPGYFSLFRFQPITYVGAMLAYSIYCNDKAALGGLAAGYAVFIMAL